MLVLYKRIKEEREKMGLSQEELAKRIGYTNKSSIAKVEAGQVDLPQSKIMAFANALHVTPAYLMGWEDTQKEASPVRGEDLSPSDKKLMEILPKLSEDQKKIGVALLEALLKNK